MRDRNKLKKEDRIVDDKVMSDLKVFRNAVEGIESIINGEGYGSGATNMSIKLRVIKDILEDVKRKTKKEDTKDGN